MTRPEELFDIEAYLNRPAEVVASEIGQFWNIPEGGKTPDEDYFGQARNAKIITAQTPDGLKHFLTYKTIAYSHNWTMEKFPGSSKKIGRGALIEAGKPGDVFSFNFRGWVKTFLRVGDRSANLELAGLQEVDRFGNLVDETIIKGYQLAQTIGLKELLEQGKNLSQEYVKGQLYPFLMPRHLGFYLAMGQNQPTNEQLHRLEELLRKNS